MSEWTEDIEWCTHEDFEEAFCDVMRGRLGYPAWVREQAQAEAEALLKAGIWRTADDEFILVDDMETSHLRNAFNWLYLNEWYPFRGEWRLVMINELKRRGCDTTTIGLKGLLAA